MSTGIAFEGGQQLGVNFELNHILDSFKAVYLADAGLEGNLEIYNSWLGAYWRDYIDREIRSGILLSAGLYSGGVHAVRCQRRGGGSLRQEGRMFHRPIPQHSGSLKIR